MKKYWKDVEKISPALSLSGIMDKKEVDAAQKLKDKLNAIEKSEVTIIENDLPSLDSVHDELSRITAEFNQVLKEAEEEELSYDDDNGKSIVKYKVPKWKE